MTGPMPLVDRLTIAGFVAPRLRAGAFPRKIKVLDESGVVTREITGEDLGKALLARVDIECSSPVPPTVCPKCGGQKWHGSRMCAPCTGTARRPELRVCPKCGGQKKRHESSCVECRTNASALSDAVRMYLAGETLTEAARLVGVDRGAVKAALLRSGAQLRSYTGETRTSAAAKAYARCRICGGLARCDVCHSCKPRNNKDECPRCGGVKSKTSAICAGCLGKSRNEKRAEGKPK